MTNYERLLQEATDSDVIVDEEFPFNGGTSGLYIDGNIALSKNLKTSAEKACILAEELGHHETSYGNILDLTDSQNRKQERQARLYGYNALIGLHSLIDAFNAGCRSRYEASEYLGVTEEFLQEAVECYRDKYGKAMRIDG